MILPPAVADEPNNGEWCEGEVKDAAVHPFSGFLPHLLCCFGADGALGGGVNAE